MAEYVDPATQQDALRSVRSFVNTLAGIANDQSWDRMDGRAYSQPYQYQTIGSQGVAVEGSVTQVTPSGGLQVSNGMLMLILGAGAAYLLMK